MVPGAGAPSVPGVPPPSYLDAIQEELNWAIAGIRRILACDSWADQRLFISENDGGCGVFTKPTREFQALLDDEEAGRFEAIVVIQHHDSCRPGEIVFAAASEAALLVGLGIARRATGAEVKGEEWRVTHGRPLSDKDMTRRLRRITTKAG